MQWFSMNLVHVFKCYKISCFGFTALNMTIKVQYTFYNWNGNTVNETALKSNIYLHNYTTNPEQNFKIGFE